MRGNNFFSSQTLLKLHRQLHNRPEYPFSTVGEAIKWRMCLVNEEDYQAAMHWKIDKQRCQWTPKNVDPKSVHYDACMRLNDLHRREAQAYFNVQSGQRMADIRAITTFLSRCGIEA